MRLIIGILTTFLINIVVFSQNQAFIKATRYGIVVGSFEGFYTEEIFNEVLYKAYSQPIELPMVTDENFKIEHLKSPYSVLQSLLTATSENWIDSLSLKMGSSNLTKEDIDLRKSKNYKENNRLKILSEFQFTSQDNKYDIILVQFKNQDKDIIYPFILMNSEGLWRLYNGTYNELASIMFLKPEILVDILEGKNIETKEFEEFKKNYLQGKRFNLSAKYGFLAFYMLDPTTFYPSLTIRQNDFKIPQKEIEIKQINDFGIIKKWSKGQGRLMISKDSSDLSKHFWANSIKPNYTDTPELAFASWEFCLDFNEKISKITMQNWKVDEIKTIINKRINADKDVWHISFPYKVIFYSDECLYVLLFYNEWFNNQNLGLQSQLMKYNNGQWLITTDKFSENEAVVIGTMLDLLKFEVLQSLILNKKSLSSETNIFISKINDSQGRIYLNDMGKKFTLYCGRNLRREKNDINYPEPWNKHPH